MIVHDRQDAYDRLVRKLTELGRSSEIATLGGRPLGPVDARRTYHEFITEGNLSYIVNSDGTVNLPPLEK